MADWLGGLFTSRPFSWERVNSWGLILMALGLIAVLIARRVAGEREGLLWGMKLAGLALAVVGALGAMRIIG